MTVFNSETTIEEVVEFLQGYADVRPHPHKPKSVHMDPHQVFVNGIKCLVLLPKDTSGDLRLELFEEIGNSELVPLWGANNGSRYFISVFKDGSFYCGDLAHARKTIMRNQRDKNEPLTSGTMCGRMVWYGSVPYAHTISQAVSTINEVQSRSVKEIGGTPRVVA